MIEYWLKMDRNCWKLPEMAENGKKWLKWLEWLNLAKNGCDDWKWLEIAGMAGYGWIGLKMDGMSENDWKWLE